MSHFFSQCERAIRIVLIAISSLTLCFIMALTVLDVLGRYFFNSPINGGTELTEHGIAVIVICAIPIITWDNKQIVVDILDRFLAKRIIDLQYLLSSIIGAIGYYAVGNRIFDYAVRSQSRNQISEYLEIPMSYIQYFVGSVCFITATGLIFFVFLPQAKKFLTAKNT